MRIVGVLSWYDESPHWLSTAVAGFGRFCDLIVAVDGAYAMFPEARRCSHPDQAEAVTLAAEAAGCASLVYRPQDVFHGNEIEKRQLTIDLCAPFLRPGEDWLFVFDADYHVMICDPDTIRYQLRNTNHDVATYTIMDGRDFLADPGMRRTARDVDVSLDWTIRTRDAYRWDPTLRVGPAHWTYSVADGDGGRRWLRGPSTVEVSGAEYLDSALVVYHRTADRARLRREAAERYYRARELEGIESLPDDGVDTTVDLETGLVRHG